MINSFSGKYRFLSNFYPCRIVVEDIIYPSTEHAYQAMKTEDTSLRMDISLLDTPGKAKRYKPPDPDGWYDGKGYAVMSLVTRLKYEDSTLRQMLLDTGDAELIEGNTWNDTYWGVDIKTGKGLNNLGKILMNERARRGGDSFVGW